MKLETRGRLEMETLFSFELMVDHVYLNKSEGTEAVENLAVALRLLDFPTLIIHHPKPRAPRGDTSRHAFNRGKACFFRMNLDSLHAHLSHMPLSATVLDLRAPRPALVGSASISLANAIDRIRRDAAERGVSAPSSHGQRGTVGVYDLGGERVGLISLSYKLMSLGRSSLETKNNMKDTERLSLRRSSLESKNATREAGRLSLGRSSESESESLETKNTDRTESNNKEADELGNVHNSKPEEGIELSQSNEATKQEIFYSNCQETDSCGEDTSVFCPPLLYFSNSAEERERYEEEGRHQLRSDRHSVAFDGAEAEEDLEQKTNIGRSEREKSSVYCNALGDALRQMPLLNALLMELSQLNSPAADRPLSVHPNLSWIYAPTAPQKTPQESENRPESAAKWESLHSPRHCSTPTPGRRRRLVFGTTKTFNLRLKRNSVDAQRQRECVVLTKGKTPKNKGERSQVVTKSAKRSEKSSQTLTPLMINSGNEDVEKPSGSSQEKGSFTEKPLPVGSPLSETQNSGTEINQRSPESRAGRLSDSWVSERSRAEDDYADDFNSYEPSDAFSPDLSSPREKTPKSRSDPGRSSDSSPERIQRTTKGRASIPAPIPASRSPQRALRGTYTLHRQTFSSEDGDVDRDGDRDRAVGSEEEDKDSSRPERSSEGSPGSSGGGRGEEDTQRRSERSFSDESEAEREEDDLGTLDFVKGYQHISELVAHKLPGYTM